MSTAIEDRTTPEQDSTQRQLEAKAREIAKALDYALDNDPRDRKTGFALLLFAFGDPPQPATWISNAERADMIRAVEEWLEKAKARQ